jgi:hypothetical protein
MLACRFRRGSRLDDGRMVGSPQQRRRPQKPMEAAGLRSSSVSLRGQPHNGARAQHAARRQLRVDLHDEGGGGLELQGGPGGRGAGQRSLHAADCPSDVAPPLIPTQSS